MQASEKLQMPELGFGTFDNFDEPKYMAEAVKVALAHGYRHLDCAELYGTEDSVGSAIAESLTKEGLKRSDLFICSKVWCNHMRPDAVKKACLRSLQALKTSYLDLYLIHWPAAWIGDKFFNDDGDFFVGEQDDVPIHETWKALEGLVKDGLVRHIGVSNFGVSHLERLLSVCKIRPYCNQVEVHPHLVQEPLVAFCKKNDIRVVAFHPIGKPSHRELDQPIALKEPIIQEMAQVHSVSPAQIILRWHIQRGVHVIPKSCTAERIASNARVFHFTLSDKEMAAISALNCDARFANPPWMDGIGFD